MSRYPTQERVRQLIEAEQKRCISLYMPTHPVPVQGEREDITRYRRLLGEARNELSRSDWEKMQICLDEAETLVHQEDFWRHQSKGLGVFIAEGVFEVFCLPIAAPEMVYVDEYFFITPLLECAERPWVLHVLALSQGAARLFKSEGVELSEVAVPGMPGSLEEATKYIEQEKLLRNRSSAGPAGSFHGEGDDTRQPHPLIHEYLRQVDGAFERYFYGNAGALVVMGLEPTLGMFVKMSHHKQIVGRVEINPDGLKHSELHERAWEVAAGAFPDPAVAAKHAYGYYAANDPKRTATELRDIMPAARAGRIETLLVAKRGGEAGRRETGAMAFGEQMPIAAELEAVRPSTSMEAAVQEVFRKSGTICVVETEDMPKGAGELAAILRY